MDREDDHETDGTTTTRMAWVWLAVAFSPALAAVWSHPGFVTQDGPAHHYNAHVLARSFDPASPYREVFQVRWEPLPNWAGHVALMGLDAALPPRAADRAMTTLAAVALAAAVFWLRLKVSRERNEAAAAFFAAMLGLNVTWLLGFSGFLLGAALFPITLGTWWSRRDEGWSTWSAARLALLVVLGYFNHLVSLGLTVFGVLALECLTPGRNRSRRLATTLAGLLPTIPLAWLYRGLMRRGGGIAPEWKHLADPLSPRSWATQLTWVDPISLARKDYLPLDGSVAPWHLLFSPVLWLGAALGLAILAAWRGGGGPLRDRERRGWWLLSFALLLGGAAGPDTLGASHGEYLQQRVVLLGLAALLPVIRFDGIGRAAIPACLVALGVQSATIWDYAETSERTAGAILRAAPEIGANQRIATRLTGIRAPFRANPLLHADCALGVGNGNIVWSNYETRFYYFPVQFRPGLDHPDPWTLERIALIAPDDPRRAPMWAELLERHRRAIDLVIAWGDDAVLDAETSRWFRPRWTRDAVTIWEKQGDSTDQ